MANLAETFFDPTNLIIETSFFRGKILYFCLKVNAKKSFFDKKKQPIEE